MPPPDLPQAIIAQLNKITHINTTGRTVPVIIVPGIMGTRLTDWSGRLVWNPTGGPAGRAPGPLQLNLDKIANIEEPLFPADDVDDSVVNFGHLLTDYYDALCAEMQLGMVDTLNLRSIKLQVYCAGYDWRQDNRKSASLLAAFVTKAIEACGGEKAIVIAHSMGGIVTRYFCKQLGGASLVRHVFLLGSPTLGAPKAYAALKIGAGSIADMLLPLLVHTPIDTKEFVQRFPSAFQLLPTREYATTYNPFWIKFNREGTGYPSMSFLKNVPEQNASNVFGDCQHTQLLYSDIYTGISEPSSSRLRNNRKVADAVAFHKELLTRGPTPQIYMHNRTTSIFANRLDTQAGGTLEFSGITIDDTGTIHASPASYRESCEPMGDGTVPAASAMPTEYLSSPFVDKFNANQADHGNLCNNVAVLEYLKKSILNILSHE